MGFGQIFTVQGARSQANHGHVADSGVSVGDTGQNLVGENRKDIFSSTLTRRRKTKASLCSMNETCVCESVAIPVRT